jgi:hypothetical protein
VKQQFFGLIFFLASLGLTPLSWAEDFSPLGSSLPPIEARTYSLQVIKVSQSDRVYLFSDLDEAKPIPGRIILLRKDDENAMAFRVIKLYESENQIAASHVRRYGAYQNKNLESELEFSAIEKIRDVIFLPRTEEERQLDEIDLAELEADMNLEDFERGLPPLPHTDPFDPELDQNPLPFTSEFDADLDMGTSPLPKGKTLDDQLRQLERLEIREIHPFDRDSHWLSLDYARIRNLPPTNKGESYYLKAIGGRYALTFGRLWVFSNNHAQDSFAFEIGAYYYTVFPYTSQSDLYRVIPLTGTLRYNIAFSPDLSLFFYSGILKNVVISASHPNADEGQRNAQRLAATFPAAGAGLFFRIGPKWHLRVEMGIDRIGGGLMLRF